LKITVSISGIFEKNSNGNTILNRIPNNIQIIYKNQILTLEKTKILVNFRFRNGNYLVYVAIYLNIHEVRSM